LRNLLVVAFALAGLCLTGCQASEVKYGEKVTFAKDHALIFPGCELVFLGKRKVPVAVYPRGFTYYDFRATAGGQSRTISWSSGTGEIGPLFFELGGKKFVLELSATRAAKGFMKDNELVLWIRNDYEKLRSP